MYLRNETPQKNSTHLRVKVSLSRTVSRNKQEVLEGDWLFRKRVIYVCIFVGHSNDASNLHFGEAWINPIESAAQTAG